MRIRIRSRMKRRRSVAPESEAAEETHGRGNRPIYGTVAQQEDAAASKAVKCGFDPRPCHHGSYATGDPAPFLTTWHSGKTGVV